MMDLQSPGFRTENSDLGGRPIDLIKTVKGLAEVSNYVDDFRARI